MKIKIKNHEIEDIKRPFYVAEAGINYDGDYQKCFKFSLFGLETFQLSTL